MSVADYATDSNIVGFLASEVARRRRFRIDRQVPSVGAHPLYHCFSRRGLLDPVKLAYDPRCQKAGC